MTFVGSRHLADRSNKLPRREIVQLCAGIGVAVGCAAREQDFAVREQSCGGQALISRKSEVSARSGEGAGVRIVEFDVAVLVNDQDSAVRKQARSTVVTSVRAEVAGVRPSSGEDALGGVVEFGIRNWVVVAAATNDEDV